MSDALQRALREVPSGEHVDDATLAAYLDGALSDAERDDVERHLGRCPLCSQDLGVAVRVEIEAEAPAETERPRNRAEVASLPERRTSPARSWMRLAAAIALAFGALLLGREAAHLVAGRLEPVLVARLEDWSQRSIRTDGTSLVVAGGPGIELTGFAMADDQRFSTSDFVSAERVALHVQPSALLGGRLAGSIEIERPVLRLIRNRAGQWNVETLGGAQPGIRSVTSAISAEVDRALEEAALGLPPRGVAEDLRVQLTTATIESGVLQVADMGRGGKPLRLDDVDLSYHGVPGQRATIALEGRVGSEKDRVTLRGEVGPFEGDVVPVYRFREVELESVPVAQLPGAPASVVGQLTFDGHLESAGRSLDTIVAAARGAGELALCCGAFEGRNLARDLLARLAAVPGGEAILQAARAKTALGAALDAPDTRYEHLAGIADLEPGTLHLAALEIDTALFRAEADASVDLGGHLAAEGTAELTPDLGAVLVASAPPLAALVEEGGSIYLPFEADGTWPDIRVTLDVEELAGRIEAAAPTDLLAWFRRGLGLQPLS